MLVNALRIHFGTDTNVSNVSSLFILIQRLKNVVHAQINKFMTCWLNNAVHVQNKSLIMPATHAMTARWRPILMRNKINVWNVWAINISTKTIKFVNAINNSTGMESFVFIAISLNTSITKYLNANGVQKDKVSIFWLEHV